MTSTVLKRAVIFGTPVALCALAAIHPLTPQDNLATWNLIHTAQIPLAAMLGISVILLVRDVRGPAAAMARLAVVPWVAFFAAYDGVAGLATGALAGFARDHPDMSAVVFEAAISISDSVVTGVALPIGAVLFSLLVFGGAAVALQRAGAGWLPALAIAAGGVVWTFIHPLIGAPAMLVFLAGAVAIELSPRIQTWPQSPLRLPMASAEMAAYVRQEDPT